MGRILWENTLGQALCFILKSNSIKPESVTSKWIKSLCYVAQ
ncbi:MAG: hypothetical protein OFPII_30050 [Osedax symbiont Rs1]|nr:MAG: hypothetical protein OFPII_30050 [Osedax symbiont Rs1]